MANAMENSHYLNWNNINIMCPLFFLLKCPSLVSTKLLAFTLGVCYKRVLFLFVSRFHACSLFKKHKNLFLFAVCKGRIEHFKRNKWLFLFAPKFGVNRNSTFSDITDRQSQCKKNFIAPGKSVHNPHARIFLPKVMRRCKFTKNC